MNELTSEVGTGPPSSPEPPSVWQRILALVASPRRAFSLPLHPSVWIAPLVILAAVQVSQSVLLRGLYQEKALAAIENNERIPEEQKQTILERMEAGQKNPTAYIAQTAGGIVVGLGIGLLVPALLYFWGLNFLLGAASRFVEVFTVVVLSSMVLALRDVLLLPLKLTKGSLDVYTSPAAFVTSSNQLVIQALNKFDIFDLYRLFLLVIGFSVVALKPPGRTAIPVLIVWGLGWLLLLGCYMSPVGQFMR